MHHREPLSLETGEDEQVPHCPNSRSGAWPLRSPVLCRSRLCVPPWPNRLGCESMGVRAPDKNLVWQMSWDTPTLNSWKVSIKNINDFSHPSRPQPLEWLIVILVLLFFRLLRELSDHFTAEGHSGLLFPGHIVQPDSFSIGRVWAQAPCPQDHPPIRVCPHPHRYGRAKQLCGRLSM